MLRGIAAEESTALKAVSYLNTPCKPAHLGDQATSPLHGFALLGLDLQGSPLQDVKS